MRRILTLCLLAALWAVPARAEEVDAIVAAIEHNAIARTTLAAYQQAFAAEQPPEVALQQLIDDYLLAKEANRYGQTIANDEVRAEAAKRRRPGNLTELEWQAMLANRMLAQQFLDFRFGDFVPVSRDEIRAYYEAHRNRYKQPLDEVEEEIRALLVPVVRARRSTLYKDELRQRYDVRINAFLLQKE